MLKPEANTNIVVVPVKKNSLQKKILIRKCFFQFHLIVADSKAKKDGKLH
jgi:hypothetical protein